MPLQTSELLQPISEASPGGSDIRYEPIFDKIKQARIEEAELPAGDWERPLKTADWPLVIKLATEALTKQSKDLQVAAWLTEALLRREGVGGLRSGLDLLTSLLVDFWDHIYPEIEDDDLEFRAAPLAWVAQYLEAPVRLIAINGSGHTIFDHRDSQAIGYEADADDSEKRKARAAALESGKISAEAFDEAFASTPKAWYKQLIADLDGSIGAATKLESVADEKFGDVAPRFAPLRDAIQSVRQVAAQLLEKKLEIDPDPIEPEPIEDLTIEVGPGDGTATVSLVPRTRADAEARIAAAARYLRSEKRTDPSPYLLLRGFRWGELRAEGGNVSPKLLVAPPTDLRSRLRAMLLDGRWPELLDAGEDVMATAYGRGWLDLQRYVLTAVTNLGTDYDDVGAAIRGALQSLLSDLPQLPSLMMMDDTPTANPETQNWLRELALAPDVEAGAEVIATPMPGRALGRTPLDRAMDKVRAGEPEKGVEMLIQLAAQERSARERFLRRSEAAGIMVDTGREAVALPILEELLQEIDSHSLDEWESGETVARTLGLLYRCLRRLDGDASTTQSLYLRICRLDPMQAIKIDGSSQPEP